MSAYEEWVAVERLRLDLALSRFDYPLDSIKDRVKRAAIAELSRQSKVLHKKWAGGSRR